MGWNSLGTKSGRLPGAARSRFKWLVQPGLALLFLCFWAIGPRLPSLAASGVTPEGTEQEKALRARVAEFYNLLQMGQWGEAEKYMTEESREEFRGEPRSPFLGFEIESVKVAANGQTGTAVVRLRIVAPPSPAPIPIPRTSHWRLMDKVWYLAISKPAPGESKSPFDKPKSTSPPPPEELKFKGHRYSFGTFQAPQIKVARFPFTNVTQHPVTITDVITGCDCLRAKLEKQEYKPGESGELAVEFDPTNYKYNYAQTIVLRTDPGNLTTYLTIVANILPPPRPAPQPEEDKKPETKQQP